VVAEGAELDVGPAGRVGLPRRASLGEARAGAGAIAGVLERLGQRPGALERRASSLAPRPRPALAQERRLGLRLAGLAGQIQRPGGWPGVVLAAQRLEVAEASVQLARGRRGVGQPVAKRARHLVAARLLGGAQLGAHRLEARGSRPGGARGPRPPARRVGVEGLVQELLDPLPLDEPRKARRQQAQAGAAGPAGERSVSHSRWRMASGNELAARQPAQVGGAQVGAVVLGLGQEESLVGARPADRGGDRGERDTDSRKARDMPPAGAGLLLDEGDQIGEALAVGQGGGQPRRRRPVARHQLQRPPQHGLGVAAPLPFLHHRGPRRRRPHQQVRGLAPVDLVAARQALGDLGEGARQPVGVLQPGQHPQPGQRHQRRQRARGGDALERADGLAQAPAFSAISARRKQRLGLLLGRQIASGPSSMATMASARRPRPRRRGSRAARWGARAPPAGCAPAPPGRRRGRPAARGCGPSPGGG
jgi:hypothetical protein